MIEPIRLSFVVACPPEYAFAAWTERTSTWWPPTHTITGLPGLRVIFEPRPGGRIFERTPGGDELDWGEITRWEPPRRLSYLWYIRADRADATDVEITFVDRGDATTLVEVVHHGWERLGARGSIWRDANQGGWAGVIPSFVQTCGDHPV